MNYLELKTADPEGLFKETILIDRRYAIGDLARMMQMVTEKAMDKLGTDYVVLKEKKMLWVLCFSEIFIDRMPKEGETAEVYTWPGEDRFGMCSRRYAMYTPEGEGLMTCASFFSVVDEETRKMITPKDAGVSFPVISFEGEPNFPKIREKGFDTPLEKQHVTSICEIDKNDHVNNSFYLDWAENLMGESLKEPARSVRRIWINYAREIRMGETVTFRYGLENEQLFVKGMVGEDSCFKALLTVE